MTKDYFKDLNEVIQHILDSPARHKLIVSGPGTGKSTFFKKAIDYYGGTPDDYLVLSFINNLVDEIEKDLGDVSKVDTFHGYCHFLLRRFDNLRVGLKDEFQYYPPVAELIKRDWQTTKGQEPPKFVGLMRETNECEETDFFVARGNYLNATGYDDSIFRVYKSFSAGAIYRERFKLIIVDEYQDFNALETEVLKFMIADNPALVVGDDDQALYCNLRGSDPEYIRELSRGDDFQVFELPFCLRCPNPVITAFKDIVDVSVSNGLLNRRLPKSFEYFPPIKQEDSEKYPEVKVVLSTVQSSRANYLGRYIVQELGKIPEDEIIESNSKDFPTVMIIGPKYMVKTILPALDEPGYQYEMKESAGTMKPELDDGLKLLKDDITSNLGWRIVLESVRPDFYEEVITISVTDGNNLIDLLPGDFVSEYRELAEFFEIEEEEEKEEKLEKEMTIKVTTYEGAKGLSAQHVFIFGLQNGDLPKNPGAIQDIEICKFLVAITRTRKQCHLLSTTRFAGVESATSDFVNWIKSEHIEFIKISKEYWQKAG